MQLVYELLVVFSGCDFECFFCGGGGFREVAGGLVCGGECLEYWCVFKAGNFCCFFGEFYGPFGVAYLGVVMSSED